MWNGFEGLDGLFQKSVDMVEINNIILEMYVPQLTKLNAYTYSKPRGKAQLS